LKLHRQSRIIGQYFCQSQALAGTGALAVSRQSRALLEERLMNHKAKQLLQLIAGDHTTAGKVFARADFRTD
jgi:hypothetical protein